MTRDFNDSDIEDEIREAFRMFDKEGNGFITSIDLMEIMTTIGDVLSFEEADVSNETISKSTHTSNLQFRSS